MRRRQWTSGGGEQAGVSVDTVRFYQKLGLTLRLEAPAVIACLVESRFVTSRS
jgi:hypothetical protein